MSATSQIDARFRHWFPYSHFNRMQSRCLPAVLHGDGNVVVSAPTGSGKTAIFELAMVRCFLKSLASQAVYLCPTRSLCGERARDWTVKLGRLNLKVLEVTGDTDVQYIGPEASVIVATPEKFDSATRQLSPRCLENVKLLLIDEVHMLNEQRGATLEVVISRMKSKAPSARYIAVSATIPNSRDICLWLSTSGHERATDLRFGNEARPVPLEQRVVCTPINGRNPFTYENSLNYQLPALITEHSSGKPTIVFCSTRRSALMTAEHLLKEGRFPRKKAAKCNDAKLGELMEHGLAIHHAGLSSHDREACEQAFLRNEIRILCSTSTLAVGVNLPAHLVIIKSTKMYNGRAYCEYSELDVLQMIGRAGRPQFDTRGVAVIMTDPANREKYENLCRGMRPIESCLYENLTEHLNAEIAVGSIRHIEEAVAWLKSTYLYIRMQVNPGKYIREHESPEESLRRKLADIVASLAKIGLAKEANGALGTTKIGVGMAKAYVRYGTMQAIYEMPQNPGLKELLVTVSKSGEFEELRFQPGDKSILNEAIKDSRIRYRDAEKLKHPWQRIFYLLQITLGDVAVSRYGHQQAQEMQWIFTRSQRIIRCIIECLLERGDGAGLLGALEMQAMFGRRMWSDSPFVLTQVPRLGKAYSRALNEAGIKTIADLRACDEQRVEVVLGRNPPFGNQVLSAHLWCPM